MARPILASAISVLSQCSVILIGGRYSLIANHKNQSATAEENKRTRLRVRALLPSLPVLRPNLRRRNHAPVTQRTTINNAGIVQTRLAGAGPGSRISGSVDRTRLGSASFSAASLRVAKNTAAVHVGKRSSPGTSSAAKVGRKAQCHPRSLMRIAPTATSSAVSSGERPPSANKGIPTIWIASARMATNQALRCSGDLMVFKKPNLKNSRFTWPSR